mgnify:CR=1 FL=1
MQFFCDLIDEFPPFIAEVVLRLNSLFDDSQDSVCLDKIRWTERMINSKINGERRVHEIKVVFVVFELLHLSANENRPFLPYQART